MSALASAISESQDIPPIGIRDYPRERIDCFPRLRFMGSKYTLLPQLFEIFCALDFETVADPFCGSCAVSYLLKVMGKQVVSSDFLNFCTTIARALIENPGIRLTPADMEVLLTNTADHDHFIEQTFRGIFFTPEDLRFLDRTCANLSRITDPYKRSLAQAALIRACAKRQPRGVFTVAGDPERYKDGRRDLRLSIQEHFLEQVSTYNRAVFDNGRNNQALHADVFSLGLPSPDLVYLDPPYVPRSDDNCYMKRYHFLEGLSRYWQDVEIMERSRVRKIVKPYTPFSYRREAIAAFEQLFGRFADSIIVLSYSSNGYPDLDTLVNLLRRFKSRVTVHEQEHRYHFGTHKAVRPNRAKVREYFIVGE